MLEIESIVLFFFMIVLFYVGESSLVGWTLASLRYMYYWLYYLVFSCVLLGLCRYMYSGDSLSRGSLSRGFG